MYPRAAGDVRPRSVACTCLPPCPLSGGYTNVPHGPYRSRCVVGTRQKRLGTHLSRPRWREVRHKSHDERHGERAGETRRVRARQGRSTPGSGSKCSSGRAAEPRPQAGQLSREAGACSLEPAHCRQRDHRGGVPGRGLERLAHLFNDRWPAHARFHGATALATAVTLLSLNTWSLWSRMNDEAATGSTS
jgi:hypothetical protein